MNTILKEEKNITLLRQGHELISVYINDPDALYDKVNEWLIEVNATLSGHKEDE